MLFIIALLYQCHTRANRLSINRVCILSFLAHLLPHETEKRIFSILYIICIFTFLDTFIYIYIFGGPSHIWLYIFSIYYCIYINISYKRIYMWVFYHDRWIYMGITRHQHKGCITCGHYEISPHRLLEMTDLKKIDIRVYGVVCVIIVKKHIRPVHILDCVMISI